MAAYLKGYAAICFVIMLKMKLKIEHIFIKRKIYS